MKIYEGKKMKAEKPWAASISPEGNFSKKLRRREKKKKLATS